MGGAGQHRSVGIPQASNSVAANWQLASHDPLTGLANRTLLRERVEQALASNGRSGRRVGLILLDLNGFKVVNDTLGHDVGDHLLQQIGPRLQPVIRAGDSIARLGGDEFVVLLTNLASVDAALATAHRMSAALSKPVMLDTVVIETEASIGLAISPEHGVDFDTLLKRADAAMYTAKASRSGVALYMPASENRPIKQLT